MRRLDVKGICSVASISFRQWQRTPRALIAFGGILLIGFFSARPYQTLLADIDGYMTLSEVSSLIITAQALYAVVLYLYLISDVPFNADITD